MQEIEIKFEPHNHRFICQIEDHECIAEYIESGSDRTWNIVHTWVAEELRGRGIAEKLMRAMADQARTSKYKVTATCSYAVLFFQRHPEYADIMKS